MAANGAKSGVFLPSGGPCMAQERMILAIEQDANYIGEQFDTDALISKVQDMARQSLENGNVGNAWIISKIGDNQYEVIFCNGKQADSRCSCDKIAWQVLPNGNVTQTFQHLDHESNTSSRKMAPLSPFIFQKIWLNNTTWHDTPAARTLFHTNQSIGFLECETLSSLLSSTRKRI